ncbi:hypothetical protein I553_4767 [Mycobacterium xenopi 4042]|uniref:Uncharacterized protein n=1 Tax=Mycobacterium xenopi 4042 TaxID=1299334 RepID=X8AI18_MYCXE|nr:hypothetical protein I553_4767 [Mycobacterium xenopi 4042]
MLKRGDDVPKGILYVESRPSSPDRDAEYNSWYDEIHLPQLMALDGFVSARRLRPVADDGPTSRSMRSKARTCKRFWTTCWPTPANCTCPTLCSWTRRRRCDCSRSPPSMGVVNPASAEGGSPAGSPRCGLDCRRVGNPLR